MHDVIWDQILAAVEQKKLRSGAQLATAARLAVRMQQRERRFHRLQELDQDRFYKLIEAD